MAKQGSYKIRMEMLVFIGILFWVTSTLGYAENSVQLKSQYLNKFVTSSTLRWVGGAKGQHPLTAVIGSIELVQDESMDSIPIDLADGDGTPEAVIERHLYVCRVKIAGFYEPGQLKSGKQACQVSHHGKITSHDEYEVLENIENGGRLTWVRWDRFTGLPVGAVAAGEYFIARKNFKQESAEVSHKRLGLKHLMGKLDNQEGYGKVIIMTPEDQVVEYFDGEVLVETEPIRYELSSINFNMEKQRVMKNPTVLGHTQLRNDKSDSPARLDTIIAYDANFSNYWGQGRAILNGLPTIIRLTNGTLLEEIKWGIKESDTRNDVHRVETYLEPGTAVNVTLYGNDTETETPYTAKLVAVYEDGANRARTIQGSRREVAMRDVKPVFSQPFFLGNNSLVPTTTTTTTTTTKATTTTTSTTLSPTKKPIKDENAILSGKKGENSSMMSDEGAETIKKQESQGKLENEVPNSAGINVHQSLHHTFLSIFASFTVLLYRIT